MSLQNFGKSASRVRSCSGGCFSFVIRYGAPKISPMTGIVHVACLFKKGDPACADNYRPISLLQIGYKLFNSMLLRRVKKAGVEDKLWKTQFGFRTGCGTSDAIFIARRMIEQCYSSKD